ncbi:hypothetical protein WKW79_05060 [Variovorax robiniae]|uniref:Zinc ribbon domain-containing protein n=1 Tax=Variovorax robiniae TaxID=1836199 RepID=A0ABU8X474_9BURK
MALVCPACGTENRSVAKFCIECIGALPVGFEPTQLASRPGPDASDGMPSALAAFAATPSLPPSQGRVDAAVPPSARDRLSAAAPPPMHETKGRKGLWVSVGALAIALVVGAAGWAAAGAGGWYIYKEKGGNGGEEREPVAIVTTPSIAEPARAPIAIATTPEASAPSARPVVASASVPAPTASAPASAAPTPSVPTVASSLSPGEVLVAASPEAGQNVAPQIERHSGTPVATAPARVAHKPQAAPASAPPASSLAKACGDMNFIASARCKVAECAKPALRQTAECRVVQAQQRLMEEKRNPTLSN